jgi:two-component system sensor histidine kinase CpxA
MKFSFPRTGLFFKIFIWFWAASLGVGLVFFLASYFVQSELIPERWRGATVRIHAIAAADVFERGGKTALTEYLLKTKQETGIESCLLDQNGRDVTGSDVPPELRSALTISPNSEPLNTTFSIGRAVSTYRFQSGAGNEYIFASETTRFSPYSFLNVETRVRLIRFPLIFLTAGLICYLLARYLTSPIIRLQRAAGELADGNLNVRVGSAFSKRNDEIADLGRDFDAMAEKLESSARVQKRLFADISHELRSPLARLGIAASLARDGDPKEINEAIDVIEREAQRMNELISQLLTLGRLEYGDDSLRKFEPVDLAELLRETTADADFEARSMNKTVKMSASPGKCIVDGVPRLLYGALENIIRNAIRHTKAETTVEVSLRVLTTGPREKVVISVRDHGDGVPVEKLDEIFQPFYRVASGRERETGGVGLGLAIAERSIRLHSGTIRAKNATGSGLCVTIEIPVNHEESQK